MSKLEKVKVLFDCGDVTVVNTLHMQPWQVTAIKQNQAIDEKVRELSNLIGHEKANAVLGVAKDHAAQQVGSNYVYIVYCLDSAINSAKKG